MVKRLTQIGMASYTNVFVEGVSSGVTGTKGACTFVKVLADNWLGALIFEIIWVGATYVVPLCIGSPNPLSL